MLPVIGAAIGGFVSSFGAAISSLVGLKVVEFTAAKAFWLFMFTVVLPLLLYNVCVMVATSFMTASINVFQSTANPSSLSIQLTGIAGWIANQIYLPQAFSTYMSAVAARVIIQFIPFAP